MLLIDRFLEEYSKSMTMNAIVFKNQKWLKFCFYTGFWVWLILLIVGSIILFNYFQNEYYHFGYFITLTILFFPILQSIRIKAIKKNFPKIKTSICKLTYSEINRVIEENTVKFIEENKLEMKLAEVSTQLAERIEINKSYNLVFYGIIGATLVVFLSAFLTSLFERFKDLSLSAFIGVSILVLIVLIVICIFLVVLRIVFEDISTEIEKIKRIKIYIDDYRLKK